MGRNAYSGFKVKHVCAHIVFYERLLPQEQEDGFTDQEARLKAREAKLTWLEQRDCQSCHYKDQAEVCLDELRRRGLSVPDLPRLTGTEKQMSWARKIRAGKLDEVVSRYDYLCHQLESQRQRGTISAQALDRRRCIYNRAMTRIVAQADAGWWIEQRGMPAADMLRHAAGT